MSIPRWKPRFYCQSVTLTDDGAQHARLSPRDPDVTASTAFTIELPAKAAALCGFEVGATYELTLEAVG